MGSGRSPLSWFPNRPCDPKSFKMLQGQTEAESTVIKQARWYWPPAVWTLLEVWICQTILADNRVSTHEHGGLVFLSKAYNALIMDLKIGNMIWWEYGMDIHHHREICGGTYSMYKGSQDPIRFSENLAIGLQPYLLDKSPQSGDHRLTHISRQLAPHSRARDTSTLDSNR